VQIVKRSIILDQIVVLLKYNLTGAALFSIMDLFESRTGMDVAAVSIKQHCRPLLFFRKFTGKHTETP